jgi:NADH-quinone oxidoreductase subunit J
VTGEVVLFWVLSVVAISAAIGLVTFRNVVHGALMLVINLLAVAGLFLVLQSPFLAVIQIIVYGGAIMVLFLFVIMLLGVRRDDLLIARDKLARAGAWALGAALVVVLSAVFVGPYTSPASICGADPQALGGLRAIPCAGLDAVFEHRDGSVLFAARALFSRHIFAFELVALLLVVATVAALLIGRRRDLPGPPGLLGRRPASDLGARAVEVPPHGHEEAGPPGATPEEPRIREDAEVGGQPGGAEVSGRRAGAEISGPGEGG